MPQSKHKQHGSLFLLLAVSFLISTVLAGALLLTSTFTSNVQSIESDIMTEYNLLSCAELQRNCIIRRLCTTKLEADNNLFKGDAYYATLLNKSRETLITAEGNWVYPNLLELLTATNCAELSQWVRDSKLKESIKVSSLYEIDYTHPATVMKFNREDCIQLLPIEITITLTVSQRKLTEILELQGLYAITDWTDEKVSIRISDAACNLIVKKLILE